MYIVSKSYNNAQRRKKIKKKILVYKRADRNVFVTIQKKSREKSSYKKL